MALFPKQRFVDGLHTSPGSAGPNHCMEALNVFAREGRVVKRGGGVPLFVSNIDDGDSHTQGLGTTTVRTVGASVTGNGTDTYVYVMAGTNPFYWMSVTAHNLDAYPGIPILQESIGCDYWNGAWTALDRRFLPLSYYDSSSDGEFISPPFVLADPDNIAAPAVDVEALSVLIMPKTDWATTTLGGSTGYWLRFGPYPAGALNNISLKNGIKSRAAALYIKAALRWEDRRGTAHSLYALHGTADATATFVLDGVTLTVDDALTPNAGVLNAQTDIWMGYHEGSDQVIGRISGIGWFTVKTSRGDGTVQPFVLDQTGTDTPYQSLTQGLRSGLPDGDAIVFHDGRLFISDGEQVFWSAPGPYVDIFPNDNFMELTDGLGNITAFASFSTALAIFKRKSIWTAQPDGVTSEGYTASILPGGKGNVPRNSVCMFGDFCLFIGEDGAYVFDSGRITKMSGNIDQLWMPAQRFAGDFTRSKLVFNGNYNQARIFVPEPGQDSMLTRALYCSLDGMVQSSQQQDSEDQVSPATWWPQGPYASTDHGFRAFCVAQDFTSDNALTLLGDDRGIAWQLDSEHYDGPTPVKCKFRGSPVRVGDSSQATLRGLAATFQNTGDQDFSLWVVTDENERFGVTSPQTAYLNDPQAAELFDDTTLFDDTVTFKDSPVYAQRKVPFSRRVSSFSIGAKHEQAGDMEWIAFQAEANAAGNRGSR